MLIDDIIEILGDRGSSLADALLKTKILLHQIGKKELTEWVNNELTGYSDDAIIPPYRVIPSQVLANASNGGWRAQSHPIPILHLAQEHRDNFEKTEMRQSLVILEEMAQKDGDVIRHIPMEFNGRLGGGLGNGFQIERAWCALDKHRIKGIIINVRSRLLDFLLELREKIGEGVTVSNIKEKSSDLDTEQLFKNAIFGDNTTILIGNNNTQMTHIDINKGDINSLISTLTSIGVPPDEIQSLRQAIDEDKAIGLEPSFDGKTGNWFTKLLGRAAKGGLAIGSDIVSTAISKALTGYIG